MLSVAFALLLALAPARAGEERSPEKLTLDRIFNSPEFAGQSAGPMRWRVGKPGYTTKAPADKQKGAFDIVSVDPATGNSEVLVLGRHLVPPGASVPLNIEDYAWSKNESQLLIYTNSKRVWRRNTRGDYWVFDTTSRDLRKLGGNAEPSSLIHARFSPDGLSVAYVRDRDIYVEDLASARIERLTKAESPTIINGTFDWVYEEEFHLYDGLRWSPDGRRIAFWQIDTSGEDDYWLMNNTAGLYQQLTKFKYPKVGRSNGACRIGVVEVGTGKIARPSSGSGPSAEQPQKGFAPGHDGIWLDLPGDPREQYVARMAWTGSGDVVLQQLNRLQNTNKVLIYPVRPGAQPSELVVESDKAWVDAVDDLLELDAGRFTWLSERDGWRRLYLVSRDGKEPKAITPPGADVLGVARVDAKNGSIYYYASPQNATQRYLYRARLDGSTAERITPAGQAGTHSYDISPDGALAIHTFSTFDTPPVTELVRLPDHQVVRVINDNKKLHEKVKALKRLSTEFFRIDIGGGVELDGWCIKPPDFDPAKRYAVLFHVYGEPAGQTVLDRWGGPQYLWHLMLAQQGYLVMSVDNRGTPAPRGREWRKCIYRQVGILAPKDQADAVKAICKKWSWVDPARVSIWGWSGGGSMSLNAIFRYPEVYHTAMSVAPVTNQRFYDTIYQERYMGLPHDNPDGYKEGSPITHAAKLKGNLLLVHGTADDNVHYANTEALINELIAANKQFTMMAYPNRSHSINEGPNTRRHLYGLLTRYLMQNMAPGAK
jgi:dipeptidyl-peptidase-4